MNWDIAIEKSVKKYENALRDVNLLTRRENKTLIKKSAERFAVVAAKWTPPSPGQNISAKSWKRKIIKLGIGKRARYMINIRGKKRFFGSSADAKKYQTIGTRGIGRAGWFLALNDLHARMSAWMHSVLTKSHYIHGKNISNVGKSESLNTLNYLITNQSKEISKFAARSTIKGLSAATGYVNSEFRKIKNRLEKKWQKSN